MQIDHDIHTHTQLSRCCCDSMATPENYVRRAADLGHRVFGISNHLWDETVPGASQFYKNQMLDYVFLAKACIPRDTCGMNVLFGAETEYAAATGTLGMSYENATRFDYLLVPHSHVHMRNFVMPDNADTVALKELFAARIAKAFPEFTAEQVKKMAASLGHITLDDMAKNGLFFPPTVDMNRYCADEMLRSFASLMENREFQKIAAAIPVSIAHPFLPLGFQPEAHKKIVDLLPADALTECFRTAARLGVAMEINMAAFKCPEDGFRHDPMVRVMKLAKAAGCRFTFGTDTHTLAKLDDIKHGASIADAIGLDTSDLADHVK